MNHDTWWTWKAERPAELRHFASGLIMTPVLYAASENNASLLVPGKEVIFGQRAIDEQFIELDFKVSGTKLNWRSSIDEGTLGIDWNTKAFGEWGLRFWVILCFHSEDDASFTYSRETDILEGSCGRHKVRVRSRKAPLMATFHDDLDGLLSELREKGYFYLASRGTEGKFAALRFNLEEAPDMHVEASIVTVGGDHADYPALPVSEPSGPPSGPVAQQALEAVHDVMAWNHVHDFINQRPYTALSRFWNTKKFGGFGVWLDDILYNALCWGTFRLDHAVDNLEAVFAHQTEAGNFPCLVTGYDAWLDRSQPPVASYVIWTLYQRSGDCSLLERYYQDLLRNYHWWWEKRQMGDTGLLAFGTSLDAGDGLYKGTKLAAKDESTMDNSPLHDPVPFDESTGLLMAADVALNSIAVIDGEVLALMAKELGHGEVCSELQTRVETHKHRIASWLWDEEREIFANRMMDGNFVPSLAPTSFFPLAAGIGTPEQIDRMIERYLNDEQKFGGKWVMPSVTRDDPAYHDNIYWRGRIWPPLNFWVYQGLRRAGRDQDASAFSEKNWALFSHGWKDRLCGENFNAETGDIHDQPDTDGFYAWGALLPVIIVSDVMDFSPWHGWSIMAPAEMHARIGPMQSPVGPCFVCRGNDDIWWLEHAENSKVFLKTNITGRISALLLDRDKPVAMLPIITGNDFWITFPEHGGKVIKLANQTVPQFIEITG